VLDLDPSVHLHEVVLESIDDALERRDTVEARGSAEARALHFHPLEGRAIAPQLLRGAATRERDLRLEQLARQ